MHISNVRMHAHCKGGLLPLLAHRRGEPAWGEIFPSLLCRFDANLTGSGSSCHTPEHECPFSAFSFVDFPVTRMVRTRGVKNSYVMRPGIPKGISLGLTGVIRPGISYVISVWT